MQWCVNACRELNFRFQHSVLGENELCADCVCISSQNYKLKHVCVGLICGEYSLVVWPEGHMCAATKTEAQLHKTR